MKKDSNKDSKKDFNYSQKFVKGSQLSNLALIAGAWQGLGYGASVGKAIAEEGIEIPTEQTLIEAIQGGESLSRASAAADFLAAIRKVNLKPGWLSVPAPYGQYSQIGRAHV